MRCRITSAIWRYEAAYAIPTFPIFKRQNIVMSLLFYGAKKKRQWRFFIKSYLCRLQLGLFNIPPILVVFDGDQGVIDQFDHTFHIFFVNHLHGGVHVAQRK